MLYAAEIKDLTTHPEVLQIRNFATTLSGVERDVYIVAADKARATGLDAHLSGLAAVEDYQLRLAVSDLGPEAREVFLSAAYMTVGTLEEKIAAGDQAFQAWMNQRKAARRAARGSRQAQYASA